MVRPLSFKRLVAETTSKIAAQICLLQKNFLILQSESVDYKIKQR